MKICSDQMTDRVYKKIFDENNRIDYTDLRSFCSNNIFNHFNIKYVFRGIEYYKTETGEYGVKEDDILYTSSRSGNVHVENKDGESTIGLCIHLNKEFLSEILRITETNCFQTDPEYVRDQFADFPLFLEGLNQQKDSRVVRILHNLCVSIEKGQKLEDLVSYEWLLSLAEVIVNEKSENFKIFINLRSKKNSTRKELLSRLILARQFMDDTFLQNPSIPEIARVSMLSEYHFYRSFKSAFGISPYQYLLNKRLEFARSMIQKESIPVYKIASLAGFSDQFSFSKAFKQKFQITPSGLSRM